jgi:hypothetical protein
MSLVTTGCWEKLEFLLMVMFVIANHTVYTYGIVECPVASASACIMCWIENGMQHAWECTQIRSDQIMHVINRIESIRASFMVPPASPRFATWGGFDGGGPHLYLNHSSIINQSGGQERAKQLTRPLAASVSLVASLSLLPSLFPRQHLAH